jgi:hypothetical protein
MRKITLGLIVVAALIYLVVFGREGIQGLLLFAPFILSPLVFIAYLVTRWHSPGSQITFLVGTIAYIAWCAYMYVDTMILHLDPQSAIALLFGSIYAAPGLLAMFWIALAFEWHHRAGRALVSQAVTE